MWHFGSCIAASFRTGVCQQPIEICVNYLNIVTLKILSWAEGNTSHVCGDKVLSLAELKPEQAHRNTLNGCFLQL